MSDELSPEMLEEAAPDLLTLEDEDGKEVTFEVIDATEVNGTRYLAVIPYQEDPESLQEDATAGSRKPMFISCIKMIHQSTRISAHPPPHRRRYRSSTVRRLVSFRFAIGSPLPISFAAPPLPRPRAAWRGCF